MAAPTVVLQLFMATRCLARPWRSHHSVLRCNSWQPDFLTSRLQRILPRHAATFDVSELRDPSHGEHGAGTMVEAVDGPRGTFGIQLIQAYPSRQHQRQHKGQAPRARREGGRRAGVGQNAIVELHTSRRRVEQLAAAKLRATVLERRWSRHKLFYAGGRDHVTSRHVVMVGRVRGQPRRTAPPLSLSILQLFPRLPPPLPQQRSRVWIHFLPSRVCPSH